MKQKFKIGDRVHFLYPKGPYWIENAVISNSSHEDPILTRDTYPVHEYYFYETSGPIKYVWIPENWIFDSKDIESYKLVKL